MAKQQRHSADKKFHASDQSEMLNDGNHQTHQPHNVGRKIVTPRMVTSLGGQYSAVVRVSRDR